LGFEASLVATIGEDQARALVSMLRALEARAEALMRAG
jgi:hypothetical protein